MSILQNKIDFAAIVSVTRANINGDPLNGNRPREDYDGHGIFSDVAVKRKLRNRLQDLGECIFVQSDDRSDDGHKSLKDRADGYEEFKAEMGKGKKADRDKCMQIACRKWFDVRAFGQVFAFKGDEVSVGVRGPVSVQQAVSVSPIDIVDMQITKSVNSEAGKSGKSSDTMGMKHYVNFGLYVIRGSINCQLAEKTGFTHEDAEKFKEALRTLFENDASSARPEGSCEVCRVYWWEHREKTPKETSAMIQRALHITPKKDVPQSFDDYEIELEPTECVPEIIDLV
ncbi:CRISPR-associated protein Cas7/Csd2, subtype I-C/DVULG [Desulfosporosinus orientis DSM 765]|uniref:CRISPR-associated protein Cas7/Csd2, subtype I-C/DVULG n=1 Tax=Desulfosporosinus orientis (strain ATCC 19365 / DSM 765 / NCIMB 8382 / VKM B-1628 / Singapore I) TaxID=768706 RepID=G7W8L6_DESOD|nr:type I-C CRISPR-associated protein Cas7/Csd2 [Desulfosporosinus orientis]AET67443.1 CRISPR-associated protein Cas7/Csd2, subtype I-C/DVULG [Desulfosporosinus orientis DSM 765]